MPSFRVKQTLPSSPPPPNKNIYIYIYWLTQNIGACIKFGFPVRPTKSCPQLVCFAEWWSSCKLELVYIRVDMTHFSSAWHATPYQPGPASIHACFLQHPYWRTKNPLICKKKTKKGVELPENIALFGALLLLLLPLHEEVISMELKVHSHLVLGTLVLSPLHHASHLGLKPTYHEDFMLSSHPLNIKLSPI
jgi:hypothetical protein